MKLFINKKAYSAITASLAMMFIFLTFTLCMSMLSPVFQNMSLSMNVDYLSDQIARNGGLTADAELEFINNLKAKGYKEEDISIVINSKNGLIPKPVVPAPGVCTSPCIKAADNDIIYLKIKIKAKQTKIDKAALFFSNEFQNLYITVDKSILSSRE